MKTYYCDSCGSTIDPHHRYRLQTHKGHPHVDGFRRHPLVEVDLCVGCACKIAARIRDWLADGPDGPGDSPAPDPTPSVPTFDRWSPVGSPALN